jgi:hypothetical protein
MELPSLGIPSETASRILDPLLNTEEQAPGWHGAEQISIGIAVTLHMEDKFRLESPEA